MKTCEDAQKAFWVISAVGTPRDQANEVATFLTSCPFGKVVGSAMEMIRARAAEIEGAESGFKDRGFRKMAGPW